MSLRQRLQFRLRSVFLITAIVAIGCAIVFNGLVGRVLRMAHHVPPGMVQVAEYDRVSVYYGTDVFEFEREICCYADEPTAFTVNLVGRRRQAPSSMGGVRERLTFTPIPPPEFFEVIAEVPTYRETIGYHAVLRLRIAYSRGVLTIHDQMRGGGREVGQIDFRDLGVKPPMGITDRNQRGNTFGPVEIPVLTMLVDPLASAGTRPPPLEYSIVLKRVSSPGDSDTMKE